MSKITRQTREKARSKILQKRGMVKVARNVAAVIPTHNKTGNMLAVELLVGVKLEELLRQGSLAQVRDKIAEKGIRINRSTLCRWKRRIFDFGEDTGATNSPAVGRLDSSSTE